MAEQQGLYHVFGEVIPVTDCSHCVKHSDITFTPLNPLQSVPVIFKLWGHSGHRAPGVTWQGLSGVG